jgi:hypothetical protein
MIPQTIAALGLFLLLVAPGLTFQLVRERRRPGLVETSFREASRIALASLCFTVAAILVLLLARIPFPDLLPDPRIWLITGRKYFQNQYNIVVGATLAELLLACGFAAISAVWLNRGVEGSITPLSAWNGYLVAEESSGRYPFVMLTLEDGDRFFGWVAEYSPDCKLLDRELVLEGPIQYQSPKDDTPVALGNHWKYLIIPASSIKYLSVAYLKYQ